MGMFGKLHNQLKDGGEYSITILLAEVITEFIFIFLIIGISHVLGGDRLKVLGIETNQNACKSSRMFLFQSWNGPNNDVKVPCCNVLRSVVYDKMRLRILDVYIHLERVIPGPWHFVDQFALLSIIDPQKIRRCDRVTIQWKASIRL